MSGPRMIYIAPREHLDAVRYWAEKNPTIPVAAAYMLVLEAGGMMIEAQKLEGVRDGEAVLTQFVRYRDRMCRRIVRKYGEWEGARDA